MEDNFKLNQFIDDEEIGMPTDYRDVYSDVMLNTDNLNKESGILAYTDKKTLEMAKSILDGAYPNVKIQNLNKNEEDDTNYYLLYSYNIDESFDDDELKFSPNLNPAGTPIGKGYGAGVAGMGEDYQDMQEITDQQMKNALYDLYDEFVATGAWSGHAYGFENMHKYYELLGDYMQQNGMNTAGVDAAYSDAVQAFNDLSKDSSRSFLNSDDTKSIEDADYKFLDNLAHVAQQVADKLGLDDIQFELDGMPVYGTTIDESMIMGIKQAKNKINESSRGSSRLEKLVYAKAKDIRRRTHVPGWSEDESRFPECDYADIIDLVSAAYNLGAQGNGGSIKESVEKHDTLNQKIFNGDELDPEVKDKLLEIVDRFKYNLEENDIKLDIKDVRIIGSNASYNYTDKSDIDLHIFADLSVYPDQEVLAQKVYDAYKAL